MDQKSVITADGHILILFICLRTGEVDAALTVARKHVVLNPYH